MLLIIGLEPVEDRDRMLDVGMLDHDLLESSVERSVLLHDLSEFVQGRRSDALDVTSRQRRLEHVRRIEAAGRAACSDYCVELVDEEDHIRVCGHFVDYGFKSLFKVSAIFGTSYNGT